jgi:DNA-binding CsgD family transcriptional regulator
VSPTECHLSPVAMVSAVLTPREMQVANLLLEARGDREIACAIGISENAVKERLRGMCRKARIPNDRVQLAILLLGYTPRRADLKPTRRQRARILLSFRRPGRPDPDMRQKLERMIERARQGWSWVRMSPEIFPHQKRAKICSAQTRKFARTHRAELEKAGVHVALRPLPTEHSTKPPAGQRAISHPVASPARAAVKPPLASPKIRLLAFPTQVTC